MLQKKRLVLGSSSAGRRAVLDSVAELRYDVIAPGFDEGTIRRTDPEGLTLNLAIAKSGAVYERVKEPCVIVTADQVVKWEGEIREKPRDLDEARRFLKSYGSGEPVVHVTSVCVTDFRPDAGLRQRHFTDTAYVEFLPIPEKCLIGALARGTVLKCAGAVAIEDPDITPHIRRIWSTRGPVEARTSVMGLPLGPTMAILREFGVF